MATTEMNCLASGGGLPTYINSLTLAANASSGDIELGFEPKHIAITSDYTTNTSWKGLAIWDVANDTKFINTNSSSAVNWRTLPGDGGILVNVSGTKLSFNNASGSSCKFHVFAIG